MQSCRDGESWVRDAASRPRLEGNRAGGVCFQFAAEPIAFQNAIYMNHTMELLSLLLSLQCCCVVVLAVRQSDSDPNKAQPSHPTTGLTPPGKLGSDRRHRSSEYLGRTVRRTVALAGTFVPVAGPGQDWADWDRDWHPGGQAPAMVVLQACKPAVGE